MTRGDFCSVRLPSFSALGMVLLLVSTIDSAAAFSTLPVSSNHRTICPSLYHSLPRLSASTSEDKSHQSPTTQSSETLAKTLSSLRLSLLLLFSAATLPVLVEPAIAAAASPSGDYQEGISSVTKSALGTSVRSTVVQSAKLVDAVDLKWERFSDSLRDNKKCDPLTNRRLFDNGYRSDGTQRGNPVLGALCEPVPLKDVDTNLIRSVLDDALDTAAYETLGGSTSSTDQSLLKGKVDQMRAKLEPEFARGTTTTSKPDEAAKRQQYNLEVYARVRAYSEALRENATPKSESSSKVSYVRQAGRKLDLLWGRNLLDQLAGPSDGKYEFRSPFPKPDPDIPLPYDANKLTNALGAIEKALDVLQDGGLIGHWEISIPEDDYGEVVTIAIDDDVCLGAQILAREDSSSTPLAGSPVVAMVRSAIEDRAKIPYTALDVFFIDPTTTKNELYNPTQLLVSLRNLGEEP